jgi:hypothetical protein
MTIFFLLDNVPKNISIVLGIGEKRQEEGEGEGKRDRAREGKNMTQEICRVSALEDEKILETNGNNENEHNGTELYT